MSSGFSEQFGELDYSPVFGYSTFAIKGSDKAGFQLGVCHWTAGETLLKQGVEIPLKTTLDHAESCKRSHWDFTSNLLLMVIEKITEKFHGSSSDSDNKKSSSSSSVKAKICCLFGREQPVHKVLGGRKPVDAFLCSFSVVECIYLHQQHTVYVVYEKYEDKVDSFAEKAEAEIKKQYAVFDAKVLSKIPKGPLKAKKIA
ncbi:hypothetical protein F0562_013719 [Nyssa sinensis]|uniref:Uncharacterized protein n=1 Tax=Nyssa sinensis TaxID=561372 RepID=A0A5J4ZKV5_9ASTE|nr:hypothetical protein F0562_013719 [Nyssa sinensis]